MAGRRFCCYFRSFPAAGVSKDLSLRQLINVELNLVGAVGVGMGGVAGDQWTVVFSLVAQEPLATRAAAATAIANHFPNRSRGDLPVCDELSNVERRNASDLRQRNPQDSNINENPAEPHQPLDHVPPCRRFLRETLGRFRQRRGGATNATDDFENRACRVP